MTGETREYLRSAIDEAVRASIDWSREARCAGCGVEHFDPFTEQPRFTDGCFTCRDRRYGRARRAVATPAQLVLEGMAA